MTTPRRAAQALRTALVLVALTGCSGQPDPQAPTGLTIGPGEAELVVSWDAGSAATCDLYVRTSPGGGATGTRIVGATSPHRVTGLTNWTEYFVVAVATEDGAESDPSEEASGIPSPATASLTLPDANLATCVAGYNTTYASQLTELNCTYKSIASITGLDQLKAIRKLTLYGNSALADLGPIAGLGGLDELNIAFTGVVDLSPLAGLTSLTWLQLNGSDVSDLSPISGLPLTTLDISATTVPLSDVAAFADLQILVAEFDHLTDLSPIAGLTGLQSLEVASNDLVDISPIASLTNLGYLDISGNAITSIGALAPLTRIGTLLAYSNAITDPSPLGSNTTATLVNLNGNPIASLSGLSTMTSLQTLYVDDSSLTSLAGLPPQVQRVGAARSALTSLAGVTGLSSLVALIVPNNAITDVSPLAGLTQLERIGLNSNAITTGVGSLTSLVNATGLWLDGNPAIPCSELTALQAALGAVPDGPVSPSTATAGVDCAP